MIDKKLTSAAVITPSMVYRSSRIKLSAGQVFWREAGDSDLPVLIFLHGSWHDSTQWQDVMGPLSRDCHCFALDLLGFGNSVAIKTPTSIAMEVDCLDEFLNSIELRSVYLVGHSLGAWIAVSYALKHPDRIQGVVAISPEGFSLSNWQQYSQFTKWLLAHPWLFSLWLTGLRVLASISDGAKRLEEMLIYWRFFTKFPTTCRLFISRPNKEIASELVADKLRHFKSPLLVLQRERDRVFAIEQSQAYARSVRQSEYRWIQDGESLTVNPSHQQIVREIQGFIDRVQIKIDREEMELW